MIGGNYHNDTMNAKSYEKSYKRINQIISETIHKHLRNILTESQESKSIDAAKKLYMERTGCSREEADEFVRITLRNDLPILRQPNAAKFILGVTRMFLDRQITDQRTISQLNTTLKYVSSDAHINEYDRNLNGMSAQDLIQRFAKAVSDDFEKNKSEIDTMNFEGKSQYEIVRIDSFEQAQQYGQYTSWCVTHDENMFNSYTNDGIGQFYFCLRHGFENEEAVEGENCPLDNYGLSMIAVSVDENGRLNTCTCRWNHDNGGNDSIMDPKQISEVIGMNFYQTFKPNNKWKKLVDNCMRRIANGEDPNDVFDQTGGFDNGFAMVTLNGKYNFINQNGQLVSPNQWFDDCNYFDNDFAVVKLNGKYNFINTHGELLWKGDEWFDDCSRFCEGFAAVEINYKYNFINTHGELLWKGNQWFDNCDSFSEGFAAVKLNGKWNFINARGELLWKGNEWFDYCWNFSGGFARVKLNGKCNYINTRGELVWKGDEWFDEVRGFDNNFAVVKLNGKYNFINTRGELVWKGDEWFDYCNYFSEGFARVKLNGKWNFINTRGELVWKGNQWFEFCDDFFDGFARVELNGKYNFINTRGELLWKGNEWFDYCWNFSGGFAIVKLNGKCNYINTRGELLWKGNQWFDNCNSFYEGFAAVKLNGRTFRIDTKGQLHNLHESRQRTLRLTESEFRKLIKESVRKTLYNLTT